MRLQETRPHVPAMPSLTDEEMKNPYLVLDELFDFADIGEIRQLLWEWLKTAVAGNAYQHLSRTERQSLLDLYEKMEKLSEAAYLLFQNKQKT